MLFLASTSDTISIITSAASNIEVHSDWLDNAAGIITPGRTNIPAITTATTTTVVGAPASSVYRAVMGMSIANVHASTSCDVTVIHNDGTNSNSLIKATLVAGAQLVLDANGVWTSLLLGEDTAFTGFFATRAETETPTSLVKPVSPDTFMYHPGVAKCWANCGPDTTEFNDAYNVFSQTDTGAGQVTFNILTDFSSADWACFVTVERQNSTMTVTNLLNSAIRFGGQAAGTILLETWDGTAGTAVQEDPVQWCFVGFGTMVP